VPFTKQCWQRWQLLSGIYQVIFDPEVYPVNFAFIDGRVSEESYKEERELAYEQSKKQAEAEARGN